MVVGSSRLISKIDWTILPQVFCCITPILFSEKVMNLDIFTNSTLYWGPQSQELNRKMLATARSLRRLRDLLPTPTKIALTQSFSPPFTMRMPVF